MSEWWKNMCAELGIRHAYAQAYHHQANGRAEVAGQQIKEILRKVTMEEHLTWVEALPQVLDRLHDNKGEAGLSPYEILFGRPRPLAEMPDLPEKDCEDAIQFFARMSKMDEKVAETLNELHGKQAARENVGRGLPKPFAPGDKVWYRRPENSGGTLDSRWLGPVIVITREGEYSYQIEVKPGLIIKAHRSFLKPYQEDVFNKDPIPLFFHRRTILDEEARPDEYEVEKILEHKQLEDGSFLFLTKWEGHPEEEATWEPINHFFHRYSAEAVRYCLEKGVPVEILKYLQKRPHQE